MCHMHWWMPCIRPSLDCLPESFLNNTLISSIHIWAYEEEDSAHQTVQLMISFEQINPFRTVTGKPHAIGPLPFECPVLIHSDETMRGPNCVPELVTFCMILGAILCIPPKPFPGGIKWYRILYCCRKMLALATRLYFLANSHRSLVEQVLVSAGVLRSALLSRCCLWKGSRSERRTQALWAFFGILFSPKSCPRLHDPDKYSLTAYMMKTWWAFRMNFQFSTSDRGTKRLRILSFRIFGKCTLPH